jgi:DNA-directed RNA polymerase subunit RPC12/RpoP
MQCANCSGNVDITLLNIEQSAEEDGVEINYQCPWCRQEFFVVLTKYEFEPVD